MELAELRGRTRSGQLSNHTGVFDPILDPQVVLFLFLFFLFATKVILED